MRPVVSHSAMFTEKPSTNASRALGMAREKLSISGSVRHRAMLGGKPTVIWPTGSSRKAPKSSLASATRCKMAWPCSSSRRPASVGCTPRPVRISSVSRSCISSARTWRLKAGWAISSSTAALLKLPASTTRTKVSICCRFMGVLRPSRRCLSTAQKRTFRYPLRAGPGGRSDCRQWLRAKTGHPRQPVSARSRRWCRRAGLRANAPRWWCLARR